MRGVGSDALQDQGRCCCSAEGRPRSAPGSARSAGVEGDGLPRDGRISWAAVAEESDSARDAGVPGEETMKRLHDDQVKTLWDSERIGGPTADSGPLEADHLQAREDVKRLAKALVGISAR